MAIKGGIDTDYKGQLQGATFMFSGLNNVLDPYNLPIDKGWLPKADNVDIDNTNSISRRGGYASSIASTTAHSGWSNNKYAYYVDGSYLKSFNGTTATTVDVVTPRVRMWYVQANDVVVYSNGIESGIIGGNFSQTAVYSPDFKETTQFGICLEFQNGRVYHAKENTVYCTDVFDVEHSDLRHQHVVTLRSKVTMIRRVEGGLYIGSEDQTHFLKGADIVEGGFDLEIIADYGVVLGTDLRTTGDYFPESKARGEIAVWTSTRGICTGGAGSNFINHSIGMVSLPEATQGCALIRDEYGFRQYIVTLSGVTSGYNLYHPDNISFDINVM